MTDICVFSSVVSDFISNSVKKGLAMKKFCFAVVVSGFLLTFASGCGQVPQAIVTVANVAGVVGTVVEVVKEVQRCIDDQP